jgi:hypothetical protein
MMANEDGRTLLKFAAINGQTDCANELLQQVPMSTRKPMMAELS